VAIPLTDTQRYDLIIEHDAGLERVQVKTTTARDARGGTTRVTVQCIGRNNTGTIRRKFDPRDYEWLFVVCGDACCLHDSERRDHSSHSLLPDAPLRRLHGDRR